MYKSVHPVLAQHERQQVPQQHVSDDVTHTFPLRITYAHAAVLDHAFLVRHACNVFTLILPTNNIIFALYTNPNKCGVVLRDCLLDSIYEKVQSNLLLFQSYLIISGAQLEWLLAVMFWLPLLSGPGKAASSAACGRCCSACASDSTCTVAGAPSTGYDARTTTTSRDDTLPCDTHITLYTNSMF